jgi:hypothetical protein
MDVGTQPGGNRLEFSEAWKSIAPMDLRWKQPAWAASTDHRHDEFQPAIPWRVALQQSPPPLRRLSVFCNTLPSSQNRLGSTSTKRGHF